jgi:probable HAF family extracellular repeat protein
LISLVVKRLRAIYIGCSNSSQQGEEMRNVSAMAVVQRWWLLGLLGGALAACGGGGPGPALAPATGLAAKVAVGGTTYSVVKLGAGDITQIPVINSSNQVAFSVNGAGGARASFFDGATVRDLGTLGGPEAHVTALNAAGQVAGYSTGPSGIYHAIRWSQSAGMVDLGNLPGTEQSEAFGINTQGQVAGFAAGALQPPQAFVWSEAAGMRDIGTLASGSAVAQAINDNGFAVGYSNAADGNTHAFAWSAAAGMADLGTLGGIDSYATLINNAGQVAGHSAINNASGFYYHGFVWDQAYGMVDIGTLSGLGSAVLAMNASGQVAGVSDKDEQFQHAIWWSRAGGIVDLGTLGGAGSRALGINRNGAVVGWSSTPAGQDILHAFLWTKAQGMIDLNTRLRNAPAGLVVTEGLAISDSGAIVAGSNAGLVLLTPGAGGSGAPVVGPITAGGPVLAGARTAFAAGFTDPNRADIHTASWLWGDTCTRTAGTVKESGGVGTARADHVFCNAGVYPVALTVADNTGLSATVTRDVVGVPAAGAAVAGGGWFLSPPGAYRKQRLHSGHASFSFVSAGATPAAGSMTLKFHVADLDFRSAGYDTLSLSGTAAHYQGSGTLNGKDNYKFLLTAVDGSTSKALRKSRLRLKVWHVDARSKTDVVDYDNQTAAHALAAGGDGSVIGGGGILMRR